jgi:predicted acetyltransferase
MLGAQKVVAIPTASVVIHNPQGKAEGDYREMGSAHEQLKEANESVINAYALKTGMDRAALQELMDKTTRMSAQTAMDHGFIDEIALQEGESLSAITNAINESGFGEILCATAPNAIKAREMADKIKSLLEDRSIEEPMNESSAVDDLDKVKKIIKALPKEDRKELGPRYFYDDAQYRYVEERNGELIGFIENRATGKKGHFNLAVLPDFRGKGYAKSMADKAIDAAPDIGIEKIFWITTPENEASRKLAEKCGFTLDYEDDDVAKYVLLLSAETARINDVDGDESQPVSYEQRRYLRDLRRKINT